MILLSLSMKGREPLSSSNSRWQAGQVMTWSIILALISTGQSGSKDWLSSSGVGQLWLLS